MEYEMFVKHVESDAALDRSEAAATAQAVLRRLGLRVSAGEAQNLAAALPLEFQDVVARPAGEERQQTVDETDFVQAVGDDLGVDPLEAEPRTRVVFAVLHRALDPRDFRDVMSQLPENLATLAAETGGT